MIEEVLTKEEVLSKRVPGGKDVKSAGGSVAAKDSQGARMVKKYQLSLPDDLYHELVEYADARHYTVAGLLRQFVKLGLKVLDTEKPNSTSRVILQEGDREYILTIL